MKSVASYTKSGSKSATPLKLDPQIYGLTEINHQLLHQAYIAQLANKRVNLAVTKKRGEVSGGGKKPWKQKGTGRARFGSSRVPLWRGGGIVFGPSGNENYSKKINKQAKKLAIKHALSTATKNEKIVIIDSFDVRDGKSASAVALLNKIGLNRKTLIVVEEKTESIKRATSNLSNIKLTSPEYLNVVDVLDSDKIIITTKSLEAISKRLANDKVGDA